MNKSRKRILWLTLTVLSVAMGISIILYQLRENLVFFYSPSEFVALAPRKQQHEMRIGGLVEEGSITTDTATSITRFTLTDRTHTVQVQYQGILPPMFREGQGMVALGTYHAATRLFMARELLTKHDENYKPPALERALKEKK